MWTSRPANKGATVNNSRTHFPLPPRRIPPSNTHMDDLHQALQQHFGFAEFRTPQEEVVRAILDRRDALVIMPTGKGKSLCYQLPAMLLPGVTVVISPLIALMKDQVDALLQHGIAAAYINSSLTAAEQGAELDRLRAGTTRIVYIAPERFRNRSFVQALGQTDVSLMAVDEAHCLSQWGHDFRPDYLRLDRALEQMGRPTVAALTATATPEVRQDILDGLQLRDPATFIAGFARPSLAFNIRPTSSNEEKFAHILDLAQTRKTGIIYCATRKSVERVSKRLKEDSIDHVTYHGGMDADTRDRMQDCFIQAQTDIAVATNAFGMGIDRPDLRFVAHFEVPGSVEAYYQEAGRAGRDGDPSTCDLLFNYADKRIQEMFLEGSNPPLPFIHGLYELLQDKADEQHQILLSSDDLRQHLGPRTNPMALHTALSVLARCRAIERFDIPGQRLRGTRLLQPGVPAEQLEIDTAALAEKSRRDAAKLNAMIQFAYSRDCRQQWILNYFGETDAQPCGNCNGCNRQAQGDLRPPANEEEKNLVRKALSGVARMSWKNGPTDYRARFGKRRIIHMLLGSKQASADYFDATELSTFGLLKSEGQAYLDTLFNAMEDAGLVETDNTCDFPLLGLTAAGIEAMHDRTEFHLAWPQSKPTRNKTVPAPDLSGRTLDFDPDLYEKLKSKRAQLAAIQGNIPPYRIFSNSVLKELAIHRPQTTEEALAINGIGEVKARKQFPHFLEILKNPAGEADLFE